MKKYLVGVIVLGCFILAGGGYAYYLRQVRGVDSNLPLIGGQKDAHGCLTPAGYSWCEAKQKCLRVWEEKCEQAADRTNTSTTSPVVGGDRDEHGCIGSAGYSWCEAKQKCLRVWEEKCSEVNTKTEVLMRYQPMQCEEEPWQTWYRKGNVRFIKAPTDEELIKAYYGSKSVNIIEAKKIESGNATCEACSVCPKSYSFTVKVSIQDSSKMDSIWK